MEPPCGREDCDACIVFALFTGVGAFYVSREIPHQIGSSFFSHQDTDNHIIFTAHVPLVPVSDTLYSGPGFPDTVRINDPT